MEPMCSKLPRQHETLWGKVSRVAGLREGMLCFVWFREQKAGKVARRVHDTHDFNALRKWSIKDEVVLEAAHTPAPHAREPGVVKISGPLPQGDKMLEQVTLSRRTLADYGRHGVASGGGVERARRRANPSRRMASQSALVIAVGSPLSRASRSRVSSRTLAWRFCSSRTSARTYSLALLYPPAATCASMKCFIVSGREIFMVCIVSYLLSMVPVPYHVRQFLARVAI